MKKILLFFACFASICVSQAQWTFQVLSFTNNCMGWDWVNAEHEGQEIMSMYNNKQYSNRTACEAARNSIHTSYICLTINCGPCTGKDMGGGDGTLSSSPSTNSAFAGPQQGVAFSPSNAADEIKQWVKDYYKQNGIDYDEAYLDELFENMYAWKEFEQMYVQAHEQMIEMNDRESYLGESDSIKQRYLVTTKSGNIYEELNMKVEERTVANPVSLDENGMPHLNTNAINPKQSLSDLNTEMEKPEPRVSPYSNYSTDITDERGSILGDYINDFLEKNDNWIYAFEQLFPKTSPMEKYAKDNGVNPDIGDALWTFTEGVGIEVECGWLPWDVGKRTEEALTTFGKTTLGGILNYSESNWFDKGNIEQLSMTYTKATIDMFAHIAGGHPMQKLIKFSYDVRYGRP